MVIRAITLSTLILWECFATVTFPPEKEHFWVTPADHDIFAGDLLNVTCTLNSDLIKVNSSCLYFTKRFPLTVNCTLAPDLQDISPACVKKVPLRSNNPRSFKQCAISPKFVTIINSTSIRLQYPVKVTRLDEGQYHCRALDGVNIERGSAYIVMYNHSLAVTNVSCVVDNYSSMSCQWALNHVPLRDQDLNVSLTYGTDGTTNIPCPQQSLTTCTWPPGQFSMGSVYTMVVTVMTMSRWSNATETVPSEAFTFNTDNIVRPSPVSRVWSTNINSSCILLSWQQDTNGILECRVEYNCSKNQYKCQSVEGVKGSSEVQICYLVPWTLYQYNVSCRPETGGLWSQITSHTSRTIQDSPWAPPEVHPGSYMEVDCDKSNCRDIILYWRTLPAHLQNGDLEKYSIVTTDLETGHWEKIDFNYSIKTSHQVSLRGNRNYRVQISSCTKKGCSIFSKPVIIMKPGKSIPTPRGFAVEMANQTSPTYLNMSWALLPSAVSVISYTIFWCKGKQPDCTGPLHWETLSRNTSTYSLVLPGLTEDTLREYIVGVSAEAAVSDGARRRRRSGAVTSSGIGWTPCVYGRSTVPEYALENVHSSGSPKADSVEISWNQRTCLQTPSLLTGVLVVYCPTDGGSECTGPKKNQTADGMAAGYTLSGLESGVTYRIVLYPVTRAGIGPPSEPVLAQVSLDLNFLYAIVITFAILLLLLLVFFFTLWGARKMYRSKEKITVVGEEKLLDKEDGPPPPPANPPPESRVSLRNGSYKQKNEDKDIENVQLLRADFYKENSSPRTSAPVRVDNCYMVPPNTRPQSRHSKRNSENNNNPPILEAKSDDSFPLLDFTDEGIPRERISSFKTQLATKDYGFAVKGRVDYEDLVDARLERDRAASQESVGKDSKRSKSPSDKHRNKKQDVPKSHKKTHSVSFSDDENYPPPPSVTSVPTALVGQPVYPRQQKDGWKPSKKERRWSRGRPDSDGHRYSDKRLSRDSDFPTPPPTPPAYTGREQRLSGLDFPTPPPPPIFHEEQPPEVRFSGQFNYPPPPMETRADHRPVTRHPPPDQGQIPSPKHRTKEVKAEPLMRHQTVPPQMEPDYRYQPQENVPIPSPKHRTKETRPEPPQAAPPPRQVQSEYQHLPREHVVIPSPRPRTEEVKPVVQQPAQPHDVEPVFRYPSQEHVPIPSPKQRTPETKPDAQQRIQSPPREVEPLYRYPSQEPEPLKETKPEPPMRHQPAPPPPRETELRSPITPDRLSKTLSQSDPDSTLDISFLLGDLIGRGVTVRPKQSTSEEPMRPKPRQHAPPPPSAQVTAEPDSPEVVMRPKPQPQPTANPSDRQSKGKSNPPKVAPKPIFIKKKDSVYGRLEANQDQLSPPPSASSTSSSHHPEYVKYT